MSCITIPVVTVFSGVAVESKKELFTPKALQDLSLLLVGTVNRFHRPCAFKMP